MTAPTVNWTIVPVRGHYVGIDGTPMYGTVTFTPQAVRFVDGQAQVIVIGNSIEVEVDPDTGDLQTALPATDDMDINGYGFTWLVKENFPNGNTWSITVPQSAAGTGIDLATSIPVPPNVGTDAASYVAQVQLIANQAAASATASANSATASANSATAAAATNLPPRIDTFTTSGTWTKPTGAIRVDAIGVSSGAGGGSGRRGAAGSVRTGGGGGAGGVRMQVTLLASDLGTTEAVSVSPGGAGGNAVTTDSTDGNAGSAGVNTTFGSSTNRWLFVCTPAGGGAGSTAAGAAGTAAANGGAAGQASSATGLVGVSANNVTSRGTVWTAAGGGSGGGLNTGDLESAGGNGGLPASGSSTIPTGGTAGGGAGGAGQPARTGTRLGGGGGAGGGSSKTTAGGKGGDGGFPGGGGGGGGASLNGFASGAGGKGGDGVLYVITYFS